MTEPKYRYYLVPPSTISLPLGEVVPVLPPGIWTGADRDKGRAISLPASETLAANTPRIRLSRLRELAPGCIGEGADAPEWINLPAAPVVLAYRPEVRREPIPEPPPTEPEPLSPTPAAEPEKKPDPAPAAASEEKPSPPPAEEKLAEAPEVTPAAADTAPPPPRPIPAWKRLLKPKLAPPPLPATSGTSEEKPPAPVAVADRPPRADDEPKLRALFMTDDELTVRVLVDLCAKLPGITGCELLDASESLCSTSMPEAFKPSSWIEPAREALSKMPGIPAEMPCITLHPPSSAVSIWLPAKFALIVVHDERGFRPGVREKIDTSVGAIGRVMA